MGFRELLERASRFFSRRPSNVDPDAELARFILDKKKFTRQEVKDKAFLPTKGSTSVFVTTQLSIEKIEELGNVHVARPQSRPLRAIGFLEAHVPVSEGLTLIRDNRPERHAEIGGWPDEKPKQMIIAKKLAQRACLHICGITSE